MEQHQRFLDFKRVKKKCNESRKEIMEIHKRERNTRFLFKRQHTYPILYYNKLSLNR